MGRRVLWFVAALMLCGVAEAQVYTSTLTREQLIEDRARLAEAAILWEGVAEIRLQRTIQLRGHIAALEELVASQRDIIELLPQQEVLPDWLWPVAAVVGTLLIGGGFYLGYQAAAP